ncbi:MAG: phenylalanine--tRNA ligase subunit alpha [Christensenellaceae bacterium]|jgi:phenylalanyl-tRNA synthetase alpha chain|nr:phenylalanine--tRNA ligase subunit alpha [Christensenellaceae bacterium]
MDALTSIREETLKKLGGASNEAEIEQLRVQVLGRKGELTAILRSMGQLSPGERPAFGQKVNALREEIEGALTQKSAAIESAQKGARIKAETLDISAPGEALPAGAAHPLMSTMEKIVKTFVNMGFRVEEGPEIELDHFNFELLNIPKNHPARDAQDTLYFSENILLRTHTSPVQARTMLGQKPPIRIICPGRVYRADELDLTHSPAFIQCEGLVVDEGITMADLKGTLAVFAREVFGESVQVRFRPSFFPFTEPSAEVDVSCPACGGSGENCRVCKGTGWVEVLGSGMVNPRVLELCGIDSTKYTGFAFGIGVERAAMLKYNVPDMRLFYENDSRFLAQFSKGRL